MALSIETKCIHLENKDNCKNHYGAVSFPIYQTATYAHPGAGKSTGFDYSRLQNPTREQLEKTVASLENGIDSFALSSGMAAISLLMELFSPGDNLIVDSDLYGGSIRLFDNVSAKNGIAFTRTEFSKVCNENGIENLITKNTKALYVETPTNPMMNVSDISLLSKIAKKARTSFDCG